MVSDQLPISRQELEFLLASMKDCQVYYSEYGLWTRASKLSNLHYKLETNLLRYEEIEE